MFPYVLALCEFNTGEIRLCLQLWHKMLHSFLKCLLFVRSALTPKSSAFCLQSPSHDTPNKECLFPYTGLTIWSLCNGDSVRTVKPTSFWDMTPCNLVEIYLRFRETYYLCFQTKASQASKQQDITNTLKIEAVRSHESSVNFNLNTHTSHSVTALRTSDGTRHPIYFLWGT
jgi:hypothetical protein